VKIGHYSEISRAFSALDLSEYAHLSGHSGPHDHVPEPLIGALFSCLLGMKLPGLGTNYLKQETLFLEEARIGETITARVEVTRLRPEKHLVDLATTCRRTDGSLIANGRALVLKRDAGSAPEYNG